MITEKQINMQMFLLLLCALVLAEGRSFPRSRRSYYDDHDDFYKDLQRSWSANPSNKNYRMGKPRTNYLVPEDSKYYIPLIDGKPIYIPDDQSNLQQPPTLIQKSADFDPEVSTLNKIQILEVPTAIRDKLSSSNANSKNRYESLINGLTKQEENLRYDEKNADIKPQCKNYKLSKNVSGKSSFDDVTCSNDQVKSMSETINYKELSASKDTILKSEIKTEDNNRGDNYPSAAIVLNPMINEPPSELNDQIISMETEKPVAKIKDEIIFELRDHNDDEGGFLQHGSGLHEIIKETEPETDALSKASNTMETSFETDQIANNKPTSGTTKEDTDVNDLVPIKMHESLKNDLLNSFGSSSRSLIFNPEALPREKFQNCETPKNESGTCRYVHHCLLPSIISSLDLFMGYVCIIQGRFIGVCCPELPVEKVVVKWNESSNFTRVDEPVKTPKECGISSETRIVGGLKADPKEYPWMVALISEISKEFFCAGSLINDRYVLTAGHCTFGIQRNKIIARLGEYDFRDNTSTIHRNYKVAQIKRHGRYSRMNLRNDIALLKLEKPVLFNQFVGTICLPEDGEDFINKTAVLTGWGNMEGGGPTSSVLMEASLKVISNKDCAALHRLTIPDSLICTGSENDTKGACNGDSGGPLMLLNNGEEHWKMIGLVSWGRRGCNPDFPTVYTRITHYLEWIRKHSER